ncbi:signal peptide, CUB and EGF-like domain-containing protein 1 [Oscarella lobularis]|uniref:signal peptide, CUB and EGF-like domain-containing protein 1 n=1 Tax=Oscarella lobularis TaxID=121494 RepID=UPI00331433AE
MCLDRRSANECQFNNGNCQQQCVNLNGSYECRCTDEFFPNPRNPSQCIDKSECFFSNGGCAHTCVNKQPGYPSVAMCDDVNECLTNQSNCNQICINTAGFACGCRPGFHVDPTDDKRCIDVNECDVTNGGCQQICINEIGGFICACSSGFTGSGNNCTDVNECGVMNGFREHDCHACRCREGFEPDPNDASRCVDRDECMEPNRGGCDQTCTNTYGRYLCGCHTGCFVDPMDTTR